MDDTPEITLMYVIVAGFLWVATIAITAGGSLNAGEHNATTRIRNEAVLAGAAEWKPGEKGEAVFTWKVCK